MAAWKAAECVYWKSSVRGRGGSCPALPALDILCFSPPDFQGEEEVPDILGRVAGWAVSSTLDWEPSFQGNGRVGLETCSVLPRTFLVCCYLRLLLPS